MYFLTPIFSKYVICLHSNKKYGTVRGNKKMASSNPSTLSPLEKIVASSMGVNTV